MSFQTACAADAIDAGEALAVKLTNAQGKTKRLAIIRDEEGGWHALDELCTHGEVSLAEGDVEDCTVECWAHGATFDLETGQQTLPAIEPVAVYPVEVRDGQVMVNID